MSAEHASVGYVMGRYPAISHTFILREVQALREAGTHVSTFSIWRTDPEKLLSEADRAEAARTYTVLPRSAVSLVGIHARAFARGPRSYLATLGRALRLSPGGLRGHLWQFFYFVEAVVVREEARRGGARHLHAHFSGNSSQAAMLAAHLERKAGWTWSVTLHGPVEFFDIERSRLREQVASASRVIAISDFARSQILSLLPEDRWDKVSVVHCGVDPDDFPPREGGASDDGAVKVLSVGRLVPVKGQAVLLEAIALLHTRGVAVEATLIGEGPRKKHLESMARRLGIADNVRFAGAVGQDEIRAHYTDSDIFCLSSFAEGLPVVLMEAMATGVPVVATRVMGVPELVRDGVNGLLVPPARPDALADALGRLAVDRALRDELSGRGRETVLAEFDVRDSAVALQRLFDGGRQGYLRQTRISSS